MSQPVNLYSIKNKAHNLSRRDSGGSSIFNPFRHIGWEGHKRSNTLNDAELGEATQAPENDTHLTHQATAPERLQTPNEEASRISKDAEHGDGTHKEPTETYDSQATTMDSPNGNGSVRRRGAKDDAIPEADGDVEDEKPKKKPGFLKHVEPSEPFTVKNQLQRTFLNSWINVLLVAAPVGIAIWFAGVDGRIVFGVNFIAIIPLAAMLSFATEEIALRTGEVLGGLINATFGNAVELIVAIIALTQNKVTVVQTSLVGSILSNLLLVLGFCFFCGGLNRREQFFNTTVAQTAASLLALAVGSLIVPTVFSHTPDFSSSDSITRLDPDAVPQLSHGVSVILLFVYGFYLLFQLKTHSSVFNEESQKVPAKDLFKKRGSNQDASVASVIAKTGGLNAPIPLGGGRSYEVMVRNPTLIEEEDEEEEPQLNFIVALATLAISTVIIALCAEGMVSGIEAITAEGVSEEFVGLILIPIVGNACEHATAVTVAIKDKMDLAIGVAIGSSMQVALFLIPLLTIIGWGMGNQDMTLAFDTFQIVVLFVAVLLVNYLIGDGKSHWLEGALLICLYLIIAVCSWFYPNDDGTAS
ncbi:Sodium/calcium exchanger protein-domain-containing protein [Biscogniauxia mediterranea]|nr:Sodium/calcium exchanger protein-domain-containing protein [Biscogniauxia mediterranea]